MPIASIGLRIWRSPQLLPLSYLVLNQATTALLIVAGVFGQSELAANIGLAHGATLATFYAFSSNARNLILTTRVRIPIAVIVAARLVLVGPLSAVALLLGVAVTSVDIALAAVIVFRRATEWIVELELSEREVAGDLAIARQGIVSQIGLLLATVLVMVFVPRYLLWVLLAWAVSPLMLLTRRSHRLWVKGAKELLCGGTGLLLPHFGATGVTGISIYVFRAILVLVAGKALAGDLFTAFAIGSFAGTLFANVFGPSISLAEERTQRTWFPVVVSSLLVLYVCIGVALLIATWGSPTLFDFTRKSTVFWRATGMSLLGGAVMLLAQRVRLRLLANGQDLEVFGSDVVMNLCLITAIPVLYAINLQGGLETLYFLNALLLLVLYVSAQRGFAERLAPGAANGLVGILAFCVFLPLFFQLSGHVYSSPEPVVDSGGILRTVPLPLSLVVCLAGVILLGRFSAATAGLWTMLGLLVTMLMSTVILAEGQESAERAKIVLMLQILLPAFGLLLAAMVTYGAALERAILICVVLVVPAQLVISWLQPSFALSHSLYFFSVYQHQQYVPVVLACAFILALPGAWKTAGAMGRIGLSVLSFFLGLYVASAYSTAAMLATMLGVIGFGLLQLARGRTFVALLAGVITVAGLAGYNYLLSETATWYMKFGPANPTSRMPADVGWYLRDAVRADIFDWRIATDGETGRSLMYVHSNPWSDAMLQIEGNLVRGGLGVVVLDHLNAPARRSMIDRPGPFRMEIDVSYDDRYVVLYQHGSGTEAKLHLLYRKASPASSARTQQPTADAGATLPIRMKNIAERIGDWKLFGGGAVESIPAFLFGHEKPIPREVRTSAHNFYIDLVYNFGVVALLPLLALMSYTGALLWQRRSMVFENDSLLMHAAVVAFLLLIECNLKVTLRQPYPGIAVYFLWGLLLLRLRSLDSLQRS